MLHACVFVCVSADMNICPCVLEKYILLHKQAIVTVSSMRIYHSAHAFWDSMEGQHFWSPLLNASLRDSAALDLSCWARSGKPLTCPAMHGNFIWKRGLIVSILGIPIICFKVSFSVLRLAKIV